MSDTSIDTRTALGTTNTKSTTSDFLSEAKKPRKQGAAPILGRMNFETADETTAVPRSLKSDGRPRIHCANGDLFKPRAANESEHNDVDVRRTSGPDDDVCQLDRKRSHL